MKNKKTYFTISEVSEILEIHEHTIRFWDSKLPGLSKQSGKGKTRFFNQSQINKLSNINHLLKNNDSLNLAYEIISKNKVNKSLSNSNYLIEKHSASKENQLEINKIIGITKNLKTLIIKK